MARKDGLDTLGPRRGRNCCLRVAWRMEEEAAVVDACKLDVPIEPRRDAGVDGRARCTEDSRGLVRAWLAEVELVGAVILALQRRAKLKRPRHANSIRWLISQQPQHGHVAHALELGSIGLRSEQGGLSGCPDALDCVPVQEAGRLLRQRELGFGAGLLSALAVQRRQLGNRTIWVLAASLGHDKARCSDKGAKETGCVRPGSGVLMDKIVDVPLDGRANVLVTKERQGGITLEQLLLDQPRKEAQYVRTILVARCRSRCATLTTLVDQSRPVSVKGGELSLQRWSDGDGLEKDMPTLG
mmetsp:Transcript_24065/g.61462  ORF Transcript_24065/g.61462 Transcript_24065/m.61462 type:complete len:299 (-) Transcript_24065:200-1096(-)